MQRLHLLHALAAAPLVQGLPAFAQTFPDKPIKLIVPLPPGSPPDVLARAPRLMLHAQRLALTHPATGQALAFEHTPEGWLSPDQLRLSLVMPW
jgi:tripartite-type tricarboxylate transporter receptor subunit TctC